jgi:deoxyribonuclease (pyrimidine dimer)
VTRINVVPVQELTRQHLVAEYREIMRLPKNLNQSLNRKSKPFSMDEIPSQYKLGKGHIKFFFNKFKFLENRFLDLLAEMDRRGYSANFRDSSMFKVSAEYYNDYKPTEEAMEINRQRIAERIGGKK